MISSLSDDEIEDRYFLLGRMEILSVLNDLIHRREPVTVFFNGGKDFFQSTLLEARPDALVFDLSGDADANYRLPRSTSCMFVSHLNGIRVQFSGSQPQRFSWGGSDAFWVPLPERVVRLQRRESYRILLPVANPVMVKLHDEEGSALGEWPSHDLSVGGLGFNVVGEPRLAVDQPISKLVLPLAKQSVIICPATIRHVTHLADRQDGVRYRVGVSFVNLPPAMAVTIQRHVIKIEHQRRGLLRGGFRLGG